MLNHDIQHNDIMHNATQHEWLNCDTQHDSHYAECRNLFFAILNVIKVSVILLNVAMLSVAGLLNQLKVLLTKCCVDQMLCRQNVVLTKCCFDQMLC
jgi:hypothetical protein